ncbi:MULTISPECIES: hypothetical protein [unclassified Duganella]|uniref:hypothetical protein n=1 Tax=unclassified Duganella TaxID=2636909 RepID=UPI0006FB6DE9|nr:MULTISPECIES: hypothetical protein [unclassified Duganella]KQV54960.1 hypothetical protein ASD07_28750 [Duganella sp. Root336D2]KRB93174.1 hypothetical protein ASE26_28310 [Duganella sp. Root198D2]
MNYEPRVVKLEVTVDTLKEELTLLRGKVDERFNEMHAEQLQLRRDFEKLIYWVAGLTLTNLAAIIGWILKAAGVF